MVKGLERGVAIESVVLVSKSGGRSGEWRLEETRAGGGKAGESTAPAAS
jgi:hypothetical protein